MLTGILRKSRSILLGWTTWTVHIHACWISYYFRHETREYRCGRTCTRTMWIERESKLSSIVRISHAACYMNNIRCKGLFFVRDGVKQLNISINRFLLSVRTKMYRNWIDVAMGKFYNAKYFLYYLIILVVIKPHNIARNFGINFLIFFSNCSCGKRLS